MIRTLEEARLSFDRLSQLHPEFRAAIDRALDEVMGADRPASRRISSVKVLPRREEGEVVVSLEDHEGIFPSELTLTGLDAVQQAEELVTRFRVEFERLEQLQSRLADQGIPSDHYPCGILNLMMGIRFVPCLEKNAGGALVMRAEEDALWEDDLLTLAVDVEGRVMHMIYDVDERLETPRCLTEKNPERLAERLNTLNRLLNPETQKELDLPAIAAFWEVPLTYDKA